MLACRSHPVTADYVPLATSLTMVPGQSSACFNVSTLQNNVAEFTRTFAVNITAVVLRLEDAPADLLPHVPEGAVAGSSWGPRMTAFLARLEEPGFQAHQRWESVPEDIGETEEE